MSQPQQPKIDKRNMFTAVALSMAIMLGWQYFYAGPAARKAQEQAETQKQAQATVATNTESAVKDLATALGATKRVTIKTPALEGSINLTGAQLDDLHLVQYRETVDKNSPEVTLLKPSGTKDAYFATQGFVAQPGSSVKVPDAKSEWQADGGTLTDTKPLTLTWDNGEGLKFTRVISISNDYLFTVKDTVSNSGTAAVGLLPYARVQRQDTPQISGTYSFYEGALGVQNQGLEEHKYDGLQKAGNTPAQIDATGGWLGFTDKYWATVLIPDQKLKAQNTYRYINQQGRDAYQADYLADTALTVPAGGSATYEGQVYAGAKVVKTINAVAEKYNIQRFDLMIDWGWYLWLTKGMFTLLSFVNSYVGNFGIAILIVTVLVKLAVFPLANRSYASMSKMKVLKPQMDAIKAQWPDDRVKQQQETMELYKREKVNPMAGCLPIFVQIPIFFSLYKVILTTIELRHAPFFGWIHDLSSPDPTSLFNLFGLIPFNPPAFLVIGFWPVLMGLTMWVQMKLNPAPPDPIQAQMFNWMPIIFTYSMAGFPAGLTIYWAWSNFLGIIQQAYIMTKNGAEIEIFKNLPFLGRKPAAS